MICVAYVFLPRIRLRRTRAELLARLGRPQVSGAGGSPQAQTPSGGPQQKPASGQLLAAAARTPMPKTPPDKGGSPRVTLAAAAAAARANKRQQRPGAAGRTLGQLLLAAAACALLLALAVPAWLRHDGWADRLRQRYPGPVQHAEQAALAAARLLSALHAALPESAQYHFAQGHGLLQRRWQAAHRQCAYLWTSLQRWLVSSGGTNPNRHPKALPATRGSCVGVVAGGIVQQTAACPAQPGLGDSAYTVTYLRFRWCRRRHHHRITATAAAA